MGEEHPINNEEWATWQLLGGKLISTPAVTAWGDNRLDVFAIGTDSRLYHKQWDRTQWGIWQSLGGTCIHQPAAVCWGADRLDVFAIGVDQQIYHKWWNGSTWEGWENLGGTCIYGVAAASWGENRIDLFSLGPNSVLFHKYFEGAWGEWTPLTVEKTETTGISLSDGVPSLYAPAAVATQPNHVSLFTLGVNGQVYHTWGNGDTWTGWQLVSGRPGWRSHHGIAATYRGGDRIDLLTIVSDSQRSNYSLYRRSTTSLETFTWSQWEELEGAVCMAAPAAVANGDRIETFLIGPQRALYHKSWVQDTTPPSPPTVTAQTTNSQTPSIHGTAILSTGETLTVTVNGVVYAIEGGHLVFDGNNSWMLTIPAVNKLPDSTYTVTVMVTDAAGNESHSTAELVVDTIPPASPTITAQRAKTQTPTITGTVAMVASDSLTVTVNEITYTAGDGHLVVEGGNWTLTIPADHPLSDGTYAVTAIVTDVAGNSTIASTPSGIIVDTTPPTPPTINSQITNSPTPTITGTATLSFSDTLTVRVGDLTYTAYEDERLSLGPDHTWTLEMRDRWGLADGTYPITATVTDAAGNVISTYSVPDGLIVDTTPPEAPTVNPQTARSGTPTITGTATLGTNEILTVTVNNVTYNTEDGHLIIGNDHTWILKIPAANRLSNGTHPVIATVTDSTTNETSDSTTNELIVNYYKTVQFIGYAFKTDVATKSQRELLYPIFNLKNEIDFEQDWQNRLTLMCKAIEAAYSVIEYDNSCLKLFIVPEFYFMLQYADRSGYYGYSPEICCKILDELTNMFREPKYSDWLFVFGSIFTGPKSGKVSLGTYYNITLMRKGGPVNSNQERDKARILFNRIGYSSISPVNSVAEVSVQIPGIQRPFRNDLGILFKNAKIGPGENNQIWYCDGLEVSDSDDRNIFKVNDITFGLDHSLDQFSSDKPVQFQIIFSSEDDKFSTMPRPGQDYQSVFMLDGSNGQSKLGDINGYMPPARTLALERNEEFETEWTYFVKNGRNNLGQLDIYDLQEIRYPDENVNSS